MMSDELSINEVIETASKLTDDDLSDLIRLVEDEANSIVGAYLNERWKIILDELERIKSTRMQVFVQNPERKSDD